MMRSMVLAALDVCSVLEVDRQTTAPEVAATDPVEELVKKDLKAAGEKACKAESQPYLTLDMVGAKASDGTVFVDTFGKDRPVTAEERAKAAEEKAKAAEDRAKAAEEKAKAAPEPPPPAAEPAPAPTPP